MELPNLKELKAILKLCRAQGVDRITLGSVMIEFGELPKEGARAEDAEQVVSAPTAPSDEELLYWSTRPDPLAERQASEQ